MKRLVFLLLLTGCASHPIRKQVYENIHEGDFSEHVKEVLGEPDQFKVYEKAVGWFYVRRGDRCGFMFVNDKVTRISCINNAHYKNPGQIFGMVLQGAGQGLQNAQHSNVNCISSCDALGNCITNCH